MNKSLTHDIPVNKAEKQKIKFDSIEKLIFIRHSCQKNKKVED